MISVVVGTTARVPAVAHAAPGSGVVAVGCATDALASGEVCAATISQLMLSRCVVITVSHHPDLDGIRKAILTVTPDGYAEGRWIKSSAKANCGVQWAQNKDRREVVLYSGCGGYSAEWSVFVSHHHTPLLSTSAVARHGYWALGNARLRGKEAPMMVCSTNTRLATMHISGEVIATNQVTRRCTPSSCGRRRRRRGRLRSANTGSARNNSHF